MLYKQKTVYTVNTYTMYFTRKDNCPISTSSYYSISHVLHCGIKKMLKSYISKQMYKFTRKVMYFIISPLHPPFCCKLYNKQQCMDNMQFYQKHCPQTFIFSYNHKTVLHIQYLDVTFHL